MGATNKATVLIVDDHEDLLKFATQVLESAGYFVLSASTGEEALALAHNVEGKLDLLVTDLMLPGITGGELRERIRQLHPRCPAIYISGANQRRIDELGLKYGATILRKPFSGRELLGAVELKLSLMETAFMQL